MPNNPVKRTTNFLDDFFDLPFMKASSRQVMKTDVQENEENYIFYIEIPGVEKDAIKVSCHDEYLNIEAEKKENETCEGAEYIHQERNYGVFSRTYYVGKVDNENIKVAYKDGTLYVKIPKNKTKTDQKRYIKIE